MISHTASEMLDLFHRVASDPVLGRFSTRELQILLMLDEQPGPASPTFLVRTVGLHAVAVKRALDKLVDEGLARRKAASWDRRSIPVELTPLGRALARRFNGMGSLFRKGVAA